MGSLWVQATGRRSFQSVSPSSWSVLRKHEPWEEQTDFFFKNNNKKQTYSSTESASFIQYMWLSSTVSLSLHEAFTVDLNCWSALLTSRGHCGAWCLRATRAVFPWTFTFSCILQEILCNKKKKTVPHLTETRVWFKCKIFFFFLTSLPPSLDESSSWGCGTLGSL